MHSKLGLGRFLGAIAALVFVAAACGSTGGSGNPSPASKGTLTVAGFNFPESSILAEIYGQALAHDGYTINYKLLLGTREVVAPALESGQIDLYPEYPPTHLEFYHNTAGDANAAATSTLPGWACSRTTSNWRKRTTWFRSSGRPLPATRSKKS